MKKIQKLLLMTAIAIGMVACSNDDVPEAPESAKGSTYASIAVTLPKTVSTRSLPEDYNDLTETWKGIDEIKTITVFLVNETSATVDFGTFGRDQFDAIDELGVLKPNVAVKGTPGQDVKAYVVLNGNDDILTTLKGTAYNQFATVYTTMFEKTASELAKNETNKDVIMMTNTVVPVGSPIIAGVTEAEAIAGAKNYVKVVVERVVSRAIVTVLPVTPFSIDVKNASNETKSTISIVDLKYAVGQSNNKFFLIKKADYVTPEGLYSFIPSESTPWVGTYFDNTGLTKFSKVENATGAAALVDFSGALTGEGVNSKFVLPVTHETTNYRKGNTTYFEVTAIFTPSEVNHGDGTAYEAGADVFLGMNDGKFYKTRELAETSGQKATMYKGNGTTGAIMKYVLWLNPDKVPGATADKATMSPTVRNQVYHAHIKGFKQIGLPNNPLNPDDPNSDFPGNPINPIKPEDPLQTEDTYLSVEIKVLPWGIHSYEIELGNDY